MVGVINLSELNGLFYRLFSMLPATEEIASEEIAFTSPLHKPAVPESFEWQKDFDQHSQITDFTLADCSIFVGLPSKQQIPIPPRRQNRVLFKTPVLRPFTSIESTELTVQQIRSVWQRTIRPDLVT
jgi:hypothetical protein